MFDAPMAIARLVFFIPAGLILGSLCSLPLQLFVRILTWIWGGGGSMWAEFILVFFKSLSLTYFYILCMAWVAPPSFKLINFRLLVSLLFGIYMFIYGLGMDSLLSEEPFFLDGKVVPSWEVWSEFIATCLGFLLATFLHKSSVPVLLTDTRGAHPYNAFSR